MFASLLNIIRILFLNILMNVFRLMNELNLDAGNTHFGNFFDGELGLRGLHLLSYLVERGERLAATVDALLWRK